MIRKREEARLRNLELLVAEAGSAVKLARRANTSASYLSQIRRGIPTTRGRMRGIGDQLAHKLEHAMGKPHGWMDELHAPLAPRSSHGGRRGAVRTGVQGALYPLLSWSALNASEHPPQSMVGYSAEELFACPVSCSEDTVILRVEGESMEPKFHEGELIYVDPRVAPRSGRYVVARVEGAEEAVLRQLIVEAGRRYFQALNPDWPDRIVEATAEAVIFGVIVFKGETA